MKKIFMCVSIVLALVLGLLYFLFSNNNLNVETSDITKYGEWKGLLGKTNLLIFPNTVPEYDAGAEYYYYNQASNIDPSGCVFLKCRYNDVDYDLELSRLKSIQGIKYDESTYSYRAFETINGEYENEYALLCENNVIVYIFRKDGVKPGRALEDCYIKRNNNEDEFTIYNFDNYNDFIYWPASWK